MLSDNTCTMWVFREGRSTVSGKSLLVGLRSASAAIPENPRRADDVVVDTLLRAGELECALADAMSPHAPQAVEITDAAAAALVQGRAWREALRTVPALLDEIRTPEFLEISPPEGFAYYAVHPLDFAACIDEALLSDGPAAVLGIRSIGTTLSAVVAAALQRHGVPAQRITVRPTGHPYDRRTEFSSEQLRWIAGRRAALASFLVVDEGPGISGSSFLSVGDALLQAGVARERITFVCSRRADPDTLKANDGSARWRAFRSVVAGPTRHAPAERGAYLGGGEWRRHFYAESSQWPASWLQMERLKFLSNDGRRLYKFHGLGRFGSTVAARARLVGDAGYGPRLLSHAQGYGEFAFLNGEPMDAAQISSAVVERIADYCAFRALEFGVALPAQSQLEAMVKFNVGQEFGCEVPGPLASLGCRRPVIADARMLPHEWLATSAGAILKTDSGTHGDDHLFPGPVDIAWDLAGAILEWGMSAEAAGYLLDRYRQRSGDDARPRIASYLLAYAVFRMAYCGMAAFTMRGSEEEPRLRRAAVHYRRLADVQLRSAPERERKLSRLVTAGPQESDLAAGSP